MRSNPSHSDPLQLVAHVRKMPCKDDNVANTLASIPPDIIRHVIRHNGDGVDNMRMVGNQISPAWNALATEREEQARRYRSTLPAIDVVFEEECGQVSIDVYSDEQDDPYFEGLGIEIVNGWASDNSDHFRECYYDILRGDLILVSFLMQMISFPFLPSYCQFIYPIVLVAMCNCIARREDVCRKFVSQYLKVVSEIDALCLINLSEHALIRIKQLIKKEQVKQIEFTVEDFNLEQRANLLDLVRRHSIEAVEICAKTCVMEGLRTYLRQLSLHARTLVIRQDDTDDSTPTQSMFGRSWTFWRELPRRLMKNGVMQSVTVQRGATEMEFRRSQIK